MGLLDFIFGNKKKDEELRRQREQEEMQRKENERIAREREARLAENRRKEAERQERLKTERERTESLQAFVFKSNGHQRYEKNIPVQGLQECMRTVSLVKNTNGCPGYKLQPGIGYIVKIYNDDLDKPNMSDKPMKIVHKTETTVELRGFPIEAQTPFGWQEVDYNDYGFVIYYKNGEVEKCVLHMYDRNIRIEYMKKAVSAEKEMASYSSYKSEPTETERFVQKALSELSHGNDGDEVYHPLYKAWRSFQRNPDQLKHITDYGKYGMGMMIFLSYGTITDIDDKQQISSVAYLFLSKAIQKSPEDLNLYKNRLILMISYADAFEYTVSSVVNKDCGIMFMNMQPFKARDAVFKMEFADLSRSPQLLKIGILRNRYDDLNDKISNGFFGVDDNTIKVREKGNSLHKEILDYLEGKVINNGDVDF